MAKQMNLTSEALEVAAMLDKIERDKKNQTTQYLELRDEYDFSLDLRAVDVDFEQL